MTTDTDDTDDEYTLDDEFEYAGWRIGRPTRTAEVDALDGTDTIEEGVLTCELVTKDQLREAKLDGEWMAHFVAPDGGMGLGLDDGNSGGVAVPYDLEATITFPTPMTQKGSRRVAARPVVPRLPRGRRTGVRAVRLGRRR